MLGLQRRRGCGFEEFALQSLQVTGRVQAGSWADVNVATFHVPLCPSIQTFAPAGAPEGKAGRGVVCTGKGGLDRQSLGSWGQGPAGMGELGTDRMVQTLLMESGLLKAPFGLLCWLPGELEGAA